MNYFCFQIVGIMQCSINSRTGMSISPRLSGCFLQLVLLTKAKSLNNVLIQRTVPLISRYLPPIMDLPLIVTQLNSGSRGKVYERTHKNQTDLCIANATPWKAARAMRKHASQLVWYRWLFIACARYVYVNWYRLNIEY